MSDPARWLPVAAIIALMAAFLYLVRRIVERQTAKISVQLDAYDYVVMEAHPDQLPGLLEDFGADGWRLAGTKPGSAEGVLYTFERTDDLAAPLSKALGFGAKKEPGPANRPDVKFQIKIKAHGLKSEMT